MEADLRKHRTLAEILEESKLVREELLTTFAKLTEPQWNKTFPAPWGGMETSAQMIDGLAWHEEEHTKSILAKFSK